MRYSAAQVEHFARRKFHFGAVDLAPTCMRGSMEGEGEPRRLLCVDADAESRELLKELLQAYDAVFACNAVDAFRELYRYVFDLYVLELWLPDWTGVHLCQDVRK